jgi:hypothetical protein
MGENEKKHLDTLNAKLQLLRDFVASVATGRSTGFYVYGPGGSGKSHAVLDELERREVPYRVFNSRMTGRALYNALEMAPDEIFVLEDMEPLLGDNGALGVLRSALWAQQRHDREGPPERLVTWSTHRMEHSFVFTGGIVMTANRPFVDRPELAAIRTRIGYLHLHVSDQEFKAQMRHIASSGYRQGRDRIDPDESSHICEFIIAECLGLNRALDIRLLNNAFKDFVQWQDCDSACHWRDLVSARIKQRPVRLEQEPKGVGNRAAQKEAELQIAAEIATKNREERRQIWFDRTGKSEQTLYRRIE